MSIEDKILVVDDEPSILRGLEFSLKKEGFSVITADNGVMALRKAFEYRPDLIILDVLMPEMSGWDVCKKLRELTDVPVIMLTAMGQEGQVVRGLNMGADDYITKPFSLTELIARVKAVLRRASNGNGNGNSQQSLVFEDGQFVIDASRREVIKEGRASSLSALEFKTLYCLAKNAGRVMPKSQILREVWGPEYENDTHYVKVYIRHLREKIEKDPDNPKYIKTRRGLGYYFQSV